MNLHLNRVYRSARQAARVALLLVSFMTALSCAATSASADEQAKDTAFIRQALTLREASWQRHDPDGYVAFTAPDFVALSRKGAVQTHGKAQRRSKIRGVFAKITNDTYHCVINGIAFVPGGATVTLTEDAACQTVWHGKMSSVKYHSVSRDFWVKGSAGWLEKRSRAVFDEVIVNGVMQP